MESKKDERLSRIKKRFKILTAINIIVVICATASIWTTSNIFLMILILTIVVAYFVIQMIAFIWLMGRNIKKMKQEEKNKPVKDE